MAKKFIERDALIADLNKFAPEAYSRAADLVIRNQPAADVVEVVRCKDCIKRKTPDCSMYYEADGEQYSWEVDDDFCSQGERRDNNAAD